MRGGARIFRRVNSSCAVLVVFLPTQSIDQSINQSIVRVRICASSFGVVLLFFFFVQLVVVGESVYIS
jgi:hypothetical protein